MKLYNSIGPNPRVVKMFLAEKGLELDKVPVDLMAGREPPARLWRRQPVRDPARPGGR